MLCYMQTHGSYLNGTRIQPNKPKQLVNGSSLTFGTSKTCYKLLSESSGAGKGLMQASSASIGKNAWEVLLMQHCAHLINGWVQASACALAQGQSAST